jgi:hypothetical protein
MEQRPSQVSFYLAIGCLTLSICLFLVVVAFLYQKLTTPSPSETGPTANGPAEPEDGRDEPGSYAREDLETELDEYLPVVLDEGRVRIAPPKRWFKQPRSKEYLARFDTRRIELPRITVTAQDAPFDDPTTINSENLAAFAELVLAGISEEDQKRILETAKPMVLGGRHCVRYVIQSKPTRFKRSGPAITYERQVLKTLNQGRIYTVTLDVFESTMEQYRDKGYAVMAGLDFVEAEKEEDAESEGKGPSKTSPEGE